jgi:hypothetical protein
MGLRLALARYPTRSRFVARCRVASGPRTRKQRQARERGPEPVRARLRGAEAPAALFLVETNPYLTAVLAADPTSCEPLVESARKPKCRQWCP